jgi:hypothetical protein
MTAFVEVQIHGSWVVASSTINKAQFVLTEMERVKRSYPTSRVRAVDENGRIVDILG